MFKASLILLFLMIARDDSYANIRAAYIIVLYKVFGS
jgi:hypothetical protein